MTSGVAAILPRRGVIVAMAYALMPPGLVMLAVIGRLAGRRFFDDSIIDGQPFAPGSPAAIDQSVLTNTAEQIVLALAIWPAVGLVLGPGLVLTLGWSLALMRLVFWAGYHLSPPLRSLGFAASFYPTIAAAAPMLWVLAH
jgi:hypothetical protein